MGMGKNLADASMAKIAAMENRLSGTLKPVRPRQEFVHGLGNRIQSGNNGTFVNYVANWHIIAVVVAALMSLAVLLAMLGRALLALSGKKRSA
jgi:hypothetical protein